MAPLAIPLESRGDAAREVTVWNSRVPARDAGDAAAGWLSVGPRRRPAPRPLRSRASAPMQSGLRRRFGRTHGICRRLSAARHRGGLARRPQPAARGQRRPRAADEPIPPESRARRAGAVRRGPHRHPRRGRRHDEARQAVHALPDHDDRPGLRTRSARNRWPRSPATAWMPALRGVTFGMNAIVVAGEGRDLCRRRGRRGSFRVLTHSRRPDPRTWRRAVKARRQAGSGGLATQFASACTPIAARRNRRPPRSGRSPGRHTPAGAPASDIRPS